MGYVQLRLKTNKGLLQAQIFFAFFMRHKKGVAVIWANSKFF